MGGREVVGIHVVLEELFFPQDIWCVSISCTYRHRITKEMRRGREEGRRGGKGERIREVQTSIFYG